MKTTPLLLVFAGGCLVCTASDSVRSESKSFSWADSADPVAAAISDRGEAYSNQIGMQMVYEVQAAVKNDGPVKAISSAHLKQLTLPDAQSGQPKVTAVKLTSLKLRNPKNKPDAADQAALDRINTAMRHGDDIPELLVQRIGPASEPVEWRVYRPIAAMPLCIKCHGPEEALEPEVKAELAKRYPLDAAKNYGAYNWRGLIRISFAADTPITK